MILFVGILFCLPWLLSWPQLLIWSLVNLLLIYASLILPWVKSYPLALLPSIWAVLHGAIFWPFTNFLVYMMPIIWVGNMILIYAIKNIQKKRFALLIGWISKTTFLFLTVYLLVQNDILPSLFLKTMWIIQLFTVLIGGISLLLLKKHFLK